MAAGKLCLVLDLDHTLVNSARLTEVSPDTEALLLTRKRTETDAAKNHDLAPELFRLNTLGMWTKLRPGVREFLRRAAEKFELWIHTNGSRAYADAVVDLLDPHGMFFGGRVIAAGVPEGDPAAAHAKRLMAGLEGREPVTIILDDSSAVWPHDRRNLFMVERYLYFPASRRKFGMEGKALLEINRDECPERGMLMTASHVLDRLHSVVFTSLNQPGMAPPSADSSLQPWDVRNVMDDERRRVLHGVSIVFSRVIPLEQDPRTHALWRLAEQFGAACATGVSEATSHVVANSRGTEKTFWAAQNGRHVVTPAWLECSCVLWRKAVEDRFGVPAAPPPVAAVSGGASGAPPGL
ncbi:hypothetical protein FOA52_010656 [Chlamydomonas sp. UWO 241]|nr:hypothetical protein FOA52_010656 [Chlamydomonas sp. UWO 241]